MGIPCHHIILVLRGEKIDELPEVVHILKRFQKKMQEVKKDNTIAIVIVFM
jgi:hypothetical protein